MASAADFLLCFLNLLRILLAVFVADKASQTLSVKIRVTRLTSMSRLPLFLFPLTVNCLHAYATSTMPY